MYNAYYNIYIYMSVVDLEINPNVVSVIKYSIIGTHYTIIIIIKQIVFVPIYFISKQYNEIPITATKHNLKVNILKILYLFLIMNYFNYFVKKNVSLQIIVLW